MNDFDRVSKTAAGLDEVRGRGMKLPQRLRTMLIMVDGTRTVLQLREAARTLGVPADFLETLVAMGLVASESQAAAAPVPAPAGPEANQSNDGERFRAALKFMNDTAVDILGLRAFFFTLKLERCFKAEDLLALMPEFSKAVGKSRGPVFARDLEMRIRQMLH
jgi:hypothetical protein